MKKETNSSQLANGLARNDTISPLPSDDNSLVRRIFLKVGATAGERLVGEALAPIRKDVVIASKFGFKIENAKSVGLDSRPEHIRQVADQSLRRLRTDTLDLFLPASYEP